MIELSKIEHPRKVCVPLAVGLAWGCTGEIFQEKVDGEFAVRDWRGHMIAGELMPGGNFIAWDLISTEGCDCRTWAAASRWRKLQILAREDLPFALVESSPDGGALLQAVLGRGGEGIVRKMPNATYYDTMTACKRLETWICRVTGIGPGQSVTICDQVTGEARGRLALRSGKIDRVRVGSVVKIEGLGLFPSGLIRDPRPCKDTETSWLVKF